VIVRATFADGVVGHGECVPRPYLTGESVASVVASLERWATDMVGVEATAAEWVTAIDAAGIAADIERRTAAFAGLELALLDGVARSEHTSVGALLGLEAPHDLRVALPILAESAAKVQMLAQRAADAGFTDVKVKVGFGDDLDRVRRVREVLGEGVRIAIDANGAWSREDAVSRAGALGALGVWLLEQPVAAHDRAGLRVVERTSGMLVSADESMCTRSDAEELLAVGSCGVWNLRIAKCGGLMSALRLARLAMANGVAVQVGSLVGETSLLGAAAMWLASALPNRVLFEGGYGDMVLRDDLVIRPLRPALGGRLPGLEPIGLGATLDPIRLERARSER
jgi:muconate cycloisomerase